MRDLRFCVGLLVMLVLAARVAAEEPAGAVPAAAQGPQPVTWPVVNGQIETQSLTLGSNLYTVRIADFVPASRVAAPPNPPSISDVLDRMKTAGMILADVNRALRNILEPGATGRAGN
jgi:hypothetical protein